MLAKQGKSQGLHLPKNKIQQKSSGEGEEEIIIFDSSENMCLE